jgi:polyisoprenoid-binding protein YceI
MAESETHTDDLTVNLTQTPGVRVVEGVELPEPGTWTFDPAHSSITAIARHMMITKVRGTFHSWTGSITVGERPEDSSVEVAIDAATIDTGVEQRDQHLRSADFLDVEHHPQITYKSTKVQVSGKDSLTVTGDLTIRGVTRRVDLNVAFEGLAKDPWGNTKALFTATTVLPREDWEMTWNQALETGGVLVSKKVDVEIEVQALRKKD